MQKRFSIRPSLLFLGLALLAVVVLVPTAYAQGLLGTRTEPHDEAQLTRLPDGTTVAEYADRTVEIRFANLLRMTIAPDDQVTITGTDNSITRTRRTIQQGEMSDGTAINPMADGALRIDLTDGSFILVWADNRVDIGLSRAPDGVAQSRLQQQVLCTFTPYRTINLRSGPGLEYNLVDTIAGEQDLSVIGQGTSTDYYVWWLILWPDYQGDVYVRSDLGDSDCDAVCGNDVCEYGETSSTCAADCGSGTGGGGIADGTTTTTSTTSLVSTGEGCYVDTCTDCYESVSCYPTCNDCTCSKNTFGCVTCYCTEPTDNTTATTDTGTAATGCDFATCDDCLAAFPCWPGPCSVEECNLNEFGCPACLTAP